MVSVGEVILFLLSADNRRKKPRKREKLDYNVFDQKQEQIRISQQVAFAAFQYLSTGEHGILEQLNVTVLCHSTNNFLIVYIL